MSDSEIVPAGEVTPEPFQMVDPKTGRPLGLEDVEESDLAIPRLNIVQKEAVFEDSLTKEKFPELRGVLLGNIKQRVLWPAEVDQSNRPLCKSYDYHTGIASEKDFPWAASGFAREDYPEVDPKLPCKVCKLQKWGSHPTREIPWCTEQWVFPFAREEGTTALITIQRSGLKPAGAYVTPFIEGGKSLFTAYTKLTLSLVRRGNVDFSIPNFEKIGDVDPSNFPRLGATLLSIQTFLHTPRSFAEEVEPSAAVVPTSSDGDSSTEIPF